ncbi:MAG: HEPN domain-containing protein [Nitrospirae bacterium]|nr:HEPN domain-containing protein [Nitrospirota bacterium]
MTRDEIVNYWISSSGKDLKAMESLLKAGHYVWALFLGHLMLEKLLKAFYVKRVDAKIPYTHDLSKIADKAGLSLTEEQKDVLDEITMLPVSSKVFFYY